MNSQLSTSSAFSHVDQQGQACMVDVTAKAKTARKALAEGYVSLSAQAIKLIQNNQIEKGDVFCVARIAGIQAAKNCANLIPLCHPLMLSKVQIDFEVKASQQLIRITSTCRLNGNTGVEMEALTAVSVASLTLFDMCKAVDPLMTIHSIRVIAKYGGKSGDWLRTTT